MDPYGEIVRHFPRITASAVRDAGLYVGAADVYARELSRLHGETTGRAWTRVEVARLAEQIQEAADGGRVHDRATPPGRRGDGW